jgi:hypothetical protein
VKRAGHLAVGLIDQDLTCNLPPTQTFVVIAHAIDAEEQREICREFSAEEGCRVLHQEGGMTAPPDARSRNDSANAAYNNMSAIRSRVMYEHCSMAYRYTQFVVQDKAPVVGTLRAVGKTEVRGVEDILTPVKEPVSFFRRQLLY